MFLAASTGGVIAATVVAFLVLTLVLVGLLLFAKEKLSPSGPVKITINGEKEIEVDPKIKAIAETNVNINLCNLFIYFLSLS